MLFEITRPQPTALVLHRVTHTAYKGFVRAGHAIISHLSTRPLGYNTPEKGQFGYEQAKIKLTNLILNEKVKIGNVERTDA